MEYKITPTTAQITAGVLAHRKHINEPVWDMVREILIVALNTSPAPNLVAIDRDLLSRLLSNNPQSEFDFLRG